MGMAMQYNDINAVVERGFVPVVFSTKVIRVEKNGDNVLIVFGFDTLDEAGRPIVEVVAKIMRPMSSMLGAQRLVAMATQTGAIAVEH